jgi:hypothetical protein
MTETTRIKLKVCAVQSEVLQISLPVEALNMNYIMGQTVIVNAQAWIVKGVELSETDRSMLVLRCRPSARRKQPRTKEQQHAE